MQLLHHDSIGLAAPLPSGHPETTAADEMQKADTAVEELVLYRPFGPLDWTAFILSLPLSLASSTLERDAI